MDNHAMFLTCPAYMDNDGATRCGLPAGPLNANIPPAQSAAVGR